MKLVPVLLALMLLGAAASGASAAPRSTATAESLCSVGKSLASSLEKSSAFTPTAGTSIASLGHELRVTFTHIKAAESIVLASSPSSLKPHFVKVFAFENEIYSTLSKAHWNILALEKNARALEEGATRIKPDIRAIEAYMHKCK